MYGSCGNIFRKQNQRGKHTLQEGSIDVPIRGIKKRPSNGKTTSDVIERTNLTVQEKGTVGR